jgi:hypothetical protein
MTHKSHAVKAGHASATGTAHDATVIAVDGVVAEYLAKQRTAPATEARRAARAAHVARAVALHAEGMSATVIGKKMAREDEKADDYSERTVRRWLSGVAARERVTD